ncbi:MAG: DUF4091 domain-containing protein [Planctomycetes bacterium]|nr:DUF4091 domain-containing protein [Planctomycetota bacterium]
MAGRVLAKPAGPDRIADMGKCVRGDLPRGVLAIWLLYVGVLTSGCILPIGEEVGEPLGAWAASDMVNLTAETSFEQVDLSGELSQLYNSTDRSVNLSAGGNETVSFQIVVDAPSGGIENLQVQFSELTASGGLRIAAEQIRLFRMWPVQVDDYPAWYLRLSDRPAMPATFYDALIPAGSPKGGMPFALADDERLALWVDVRIPSAARAGQYTGAIKLHGRTGAKGRLGGRPIGTTMKLKLRVLDFVLPNTRALTVLGGFDHRDLMAHSLIRDGEGYVPDWMDRSDPLVAKGLVAIRELMTMAHEHGLDLFDVALRPALKRDADGKVELYWGDYDAIVKPYLDGTAFSDRIGCSAWGGPFEAGWPDPSRYGGPGSEAYEVTAAAVIAQTAGHFKEMGFSDRLFFWPVRGQVGSGARDRFALLARLIRRCAPGTPILTELSGPAESGDDGRLFDMLAPPAQLLDPENDRVGGGTSFLKVYLAPGEPPYMPALDVIASPADVRAVPWLADRVRLDGLFLPDVLHWGREGGELSPRGEVRLFYPGRIAGLDIAIPSIRLKRLRRGLEDMGYLWLLRRRGGGETAERISGAMARYVGLQAAGDNALDGRLDGWAADGASWQMAGKLLAIEVLAAVRPGSESADGTMENRFAWQRFDEVVRRVWVERMHSRVVTIGDELHVSIFADLDNQLDRPVQVTLELSDPPEGYRLLDGKAQLASFAPGERSTLSVSFACPRLGPGPTGKLDVPVKMKIVDGTDRKKTQTIWVGVPILVSKPARKVIVIDGDLSDWPLGTSNTAGRFRLLGRRGRKDDGLASRQTTVFVMHDATNLYLAFRCDSPSDAEMKALATNVVHYEQLLATGEDLVEVILDPGAKAKSADDLYRLTVKANGVLAAGRGAPADSVAGLIDAGSWSIPATVHVRRTDDVWIVEMALPREAFGPAGQEWQWGINFARYCTETAEASNWSETPRHYYAPKCLGALLLGEAGE